MKQTVILLLGMVVAIAAYAIEPNYEKAMVRSLEKLDQAQTPDEFQDVANRFTRIGEAESDKWLPFYYASYAMTIAAIVVEDPTSKDGYLDAAQKHLDTTSQMEHDSTEVLALQGFVYMIRITVDPATRGMQFSGLSDQYFTQAAGISPENPRVLYLQAQLSYGTAQFFGSDTSEACTMNDKALVQFDFESKYGDDLAPSWGRNQSEAFKQQCSQ